MALAMDTVTIGKWILAAGFLLIVIGALFYLLGRSGVPLGTLPGDIKIARKGFYFYFPLVTCIFLSIFLTVLLAILSRIFKWRP